MNYHITIDDKFIDSFIEDAEDVSIPNFNIYFVRGDKLNPRHVLHPKATWIDDIWSDEFRNILDSITSNDKIIVHWYDLEIGRLMLTIKKQIQLYVAVWGGDFYGDPFLYKTKWLFDSLTWKYILKNYYPKVKFARRPDYLIRQLWRLYNHRIEIKKIKLIKRQSVKRINTILLYPGDDTELNLIKKLYKTGPVNFLPFLYNQNFDLANSLWEDKNLNKKMLKVQIGNSAAETNNHLDCFEILEKFKNNTIKIILPLSYGSKEYSSHLKKAGYIVFNDKFSTLEKFMCREDYIKYLKSIDICIMYHNRSQAFGNCIALLTLGKKLYLKSQNPLYQLFKSSGLVVFDVATIKEQSFDDFSKLLSSKEIHDNIEKISELFSRKKRLEYLSEVLN